MFEFYVRIRETNEWEWRITADPMIRDKVTELMEDTYGKAYVKSEFKEAQRD